MVKCFWFLHCYKYIRSVERNGTVIQLTPVSLGARPADGLHDMWTSAGCFAVRPHSNIVLHHLEKLHRRGERCADRRRAKVGLRPTGCDDEKVNRYGVFPLPRASHAASGPPGEIVSRNQS